MAVCLHFGGKMREDLDDAQRRKCAKCEWRDKNMDRIVICPWSRHCIKPDPDPDDETISKLAENKNSRK